MVLSRKSIMMPVSINRIVLFLNVLSFSYLAVTSAAKTQGEITRMRRAGFLSSPEECARQCYDDEPSRTCYYHWTIELYSVLGGACSLCTPNNTDVSNKCQCVLADGFERGILTANRMLPGPGIEVCLGDKVIVDVENRMPGMETTMHWHGLYQNGTQYYDGVPFLTQCPIPEGTTFRYQWKAENAGTHYWHAHAGLQKLDGLYGSLIVRQPSTKDPNSILYQNDLSAHVIVISDWMHERSTEHFPGLYHRLVGEDAQAVLINGMGQYKNPETGNTTDTPLAEFIVNPAKTYRFRMINAFSTDCPAQLTIQRHNLTIIASDGQPIEPVEVKTINSFSGERYDFILQANQYPGTYWIQLRGLGDCGNKRVQQLAILRYAGASIRPLSRPPTYDKTLSKGVVLNPLYGIEGTSGTGAVHIDQLRYAGPMDAGITKKKPDVQIFMPFHFYLYNSKELFGSNSYNTFLIPPVLIPVISLVDNISYQDPSSPPLTQIGDIPPEQFCDSENRPANCEAPCTCTHVKRVPLNAVVEIILIDEVPQVNLSHPFHLHGYSFHVIGIGESSNSKAQNLTTDAVRDLDRMGKLRRNFEQPPAKDTIAVPRGGYVIVRFRASNPGFWLLHCHFVYHQVIGMKVVIHVGDFADLPRIPRNFPVCGNYRPAITDNC